MNTEESSSKIRGFQFGWRLSIWGFILTTFLSQKVHGDLTEGPQSTTARVGQNVVLRCVTNTNVNLRWSYLKKHSSQFEGIYNGDSVDPKLSQVFSVNKNGKGKYELQFNMSENTAATYACFEPGTEMTLKAEVTLQNGFTEEKEPASNFGKVNSNQSLMVIGVLTALQMAIKKDWLLHLITWLDLMNSNA